MKDCATNETLRMAMKRCTDLYLTGHRELLQAV